MNKIIFLDIDGVLNSSSFTDNIIFDKLYSKVDNGNMNDIVNRKMLEIDMNKLFMLRDICNLTGAKIVISSGWRLLYNYPLVEDKLVSLGLPIVGITPYVDGNRGDEIRKYLEENEVDDFVILDDDVFSDYNELENYLVKTDYYDDGLTEDIANDVVRILKRK